MPNLIPRLLVYIVIVVFSLMFAGMIMRVSIDVIEGETRLIMNSLVLSPEGFIYSENGRAYPGVIDINRFDYSVVSAAFNMPKEDYWGYNLTLFNANGEKIKSIVENRVWHARWKVIAASRAVGSGAAINMIERYYIQIKYPDRLEPGVLQIDVTRPTK
jgi:hypothetical protein